MYGSLGHLTPAEHVRQQIENRSQEAEHLLNLCGSVFWEVSITRKLSYHLVQKTGAGQ